MITPEKRKKMEDLIFGFYESIDKTGRNKEKWENYFHSLTDAQFDRFFKDFFANPNQYLTLDIVDYEIDLRMEDIERAAKFLKVPLFEHVAFKHYTMDKDRVLVTKQPVPVGYCHIKATQQMVSKKNGLSTTSDKRSSITGQVTGKDKNGRESDLENSMLVSIGMNDALKELNGPRADDPVMKEQMYTAINTKGFVSLEDMESDPANKTTLNTVNTFLLGMGLNSDLVTKGLMLNKTLKEES